MVCGNEEFVFCARQSKKGVWETVEIGQRGAEKSGSKSPVSSSDAKDGEEAPEGKVNYVHYDPEMHWCRVCNVFPRTAKEYLHHLHSQEHKDETAVSRVKYIGQVY